MVIIPLNKLFAVSGNKYLFTKAAMYAVDKVGNIDEYPEKDLNWKVVPNILKLQLDNKFQFQEIENDAESETEDQAVEEQPEEQPAEEIANETEAAEKETSKEETE